MPIEPSFEALPPERRIALAFTPVALRPALRAVLLLDARLAGVVTRAHEPLLGQMRLAWWRERLSEPPTAWPPGDPLLALLAAHWRGPASLVPLVDGWEELLGAAPLSSESLARFSAGRGAGLASFGDLAAAGHHRHAIASAGERWALADFASHASDRQERTEAFMLADALPPPGPLPRRLRGIAVLDGLAARSGARREPLFAGRGAALAALRLGMLGR